jgi:hypothetical protein
MLKMDGCMEETTWPSFESFTKKASTRQFAQLEVERRAVSDLSRQACPLGEKRTAHTRDFVVRKRNARRAAGGLQTVRN